MRLSVPRCDPTAYAALRNVAHAERHSATDRAPSSRKVAPDRSKLQGREDSLRHPTPRSVR